MIRKLGLGITAATLALLVPLAAAYASVTFGPESGTGFVGKGDVQLVYGWNNKQFQDNAGLVKFRSNSETVTEAVWECTNANNQKIQERERTTTTSTEGVVTSVARMKTQITGFNLMGYGQDSLQASSNDGPPLNSCPSGPWSLTTPAGEPVVVNETSAVEVGLNEGGWQPLGQ